MTNKAKPPVPKFEDNVPNATARLQQIAEDLSFRVIADGFLCEIKREKDVVDEFSLECTEDMNTW